jgi:hypothetical protein
LISTLESLPDKGLSLRGRPDLPVAALGGVVGSGRFVDISDAALQLDGVPLPGANTAERLKELDTQLSAEQSAGAPPRVASSLLYLAVSANTDIRTLRSYLQPIPRSFDIHLLFQAPEMEGKKRTGVAEQLRSEIAPAPRRQLAQAAYAKLARCSAVQQAVDGIPAGDPAERWPALRAALLKALPECQCGDLDAAGLREVLLAEQRAGAAALGGVPFDFVRDERCGASLGQTPVQNVLHDIENFDAKFAGAYSDNALDFDQVVNNEHLVNYLCQALPGETLAALSREHRTFFWRIRGVEHCQPWQFEPLAPGSPMGTWRRKPSAGQLPLAVHYWQGAEEIRLYGPVPDRTSKPTDERNWTCSQEFRLLGVDEQSIRVEGGRWFFEAAACEKSSPDEAAFSGCVAALAGGPLAPGSASPATFPGADRPAASGTEDGSERRDSP